MPANIGKLATIKHGDGASPEVFTEILKVMDLVAPKLGWETEETTSHGSSYYPEFQKTMRARQECTFLLEYDGNNTQHVALRTAADDPQDTPTNFHLNIPGWGAMDFAALVDMELSTRMKELTKTPVRLIVTGEITQVAED